MSAQPFRAPHGGRIDRRRPLGFTFDGAAFSGFHGDTLASALVANGVTLVGRSFKYHRRRGILSAGVEEPNALVQLGAGARTEPNMRATQVELTGGLAAHSQNRWPSLRFDAGAVNNFFSPLLPAGFYNKTFKWPPAWWMGYEFFIRRMAGLGRAPSAADPDCYTRRFAHCDVLVVGGGAAGLAAARAAANGGAKVFLLEQDFCFGGALLASGAEINGAAAADWVDGEVDFLNGAPGVTLLARTAAFGVYDDNLICACQRLGGGEVFDAEKTKKPRQRLWWIRARRVVLCSGALERPLVFPGNDTPGVMLAAAAVTYARRFAALAGRNAVVFTNNDSAYDVIPALHEAGGAVAMVVDSREGGAGAAAAALAEQHGVTVRRGAVVTAVRGGRRVRGAVVDGAAATVDCDLLCVSGGWNPTVHLFSQAQGRLRYADGIAAFVPDGGADNFTAAGAVTGESGTAGCIAAGAHAGAAAAAAVRGVGVTVSDAATVTVTGDLCASMEPITALWTVDGGRGKAFVDFQNDVTAADIALAHREGYSKVEHLKRYTTLGMGTDQGRTSGVIGAAIMAGLCGRTVGAGGATTFRPPFTAVTLGAIAGAERGAEFMPLRRSPLHHWHVNNGAVMVNVDLWQRAQFYPRGGETMMQAVNREARHVREKAGLVDVSTLGKICIRGRDAGVFLERVYINKWTTLRAGRCRYGLMLREDGFVLDDGTTTRIAGGEYYMTTTTARAAEVLAHLEFYAQTVWPELQVHLDSVTDQWAAAALAGPRAREVLAAAVDRGAAVDNDALPFMGYAEAAVDGCPVRLFRITFSGERAYEVHMPAGYAEAVWSRLLAAGAGFGIAPYGTEAMNVLRIEKGHVTGAELDGTTLAADLGFAAMQKTDGDFIGRRSLERPGFQAPRMELVGLAADDNKPIARGAQLIDEPGLPAQAVMAGHVTSACYSANLNKEIALALLRGGRGLHGGKMFAASPLSGASTPVTVTSPVFIDPPGERARG